MLRPAAMIMFLFFLAAGAPSTLPAEGPDQGTKRCKFVVKKINGKKKRVRVCRKNVPKPPSPGLKVVATVPVGFSPAGIAVGYGSVWASSWFTESAGKVVRIDPKTNVVSATISLPATGFTWVAVGAGAVWVSIAEGGGEPTPADKLTIVRIDPQTNAVVATVRAGVAPARPAPLAVGEGAVWATNFAESTVARIDPAGNAVVAKIPTTAEPQRDERGHPSGIAVTSGAIWVMNHRENTLLRIDPRTNQIVAELTTQNGRVGAGEGAVWVASAGGYVVDRVDPDANRVAAQISGCSQTHDVAIGGSSVWVTESAGLCRISLTQNRVDARIRVTRGASKTFGVSYGEGAAWVTDLIANTVVRVEAAR